jgi:hypothetical protein
MLNSSGTFTINGVATEVPEQDVAHTSTEEELAFRNSGD